MLDLRWLREHPAEFDAALVRRGLAPLAERVLALDAERRRVETELQQHQAERNALSRRIGELKARGEPAEAVMAQVGGLKDNNRRGEGRVAHLAPPADQLLAACPNRSFLEAHGFGLDAYIAEPLRLEDGLAVAPDRPGHGIAFDWSGLDRLRA